MMVGSHKRILVTGGAGFIGSHLVERLVSSGTNVIVVDDFATGNIDNLSSVLDHVEIVEVDVGEYFKSEAQFITGFNVIFHLAANPYIPYSVKDPRNDFERNLINTFLILESLRKTQATTRLVNVSSAAVYGNPERNPISEGDLTIPISPYGVSKLAAERYAYVYSQIYGISATSARLFSVYGPRQLKQVVFDFMQKLDNNPLELEIIGDGSQSRDFVYVEDVVDALILLSTKAPGKGEVYNVSSGSSNSIAELARMVCRVCDVDPHIIYTGSLRPGDAEKWEVDINMISSLGYRSNTSLFDGLSAIKLWYDQIH